MKVPPNSFKSVGGSVAPRTPAYGLETSRVLAMDVCVEREQTQKAILSVTTLEHDENDQSSQKHIRCDRGSTFVPRERRRLHRWRHSHDRRMDSEAVNFSKLASAM